MNKNLTIKIEKSGFGKDVTYKAVLSELNESIVLAESLEDLFEAIKSTIIVYEAEVLLNEAKVTSN